VTGYRVASFDVEEHFRIEAASGMIFSQDLKEQYGHRMERVTRELLLQLEEKQVRGTFYIVGQIAKTYPLLVREIHEAGHEVGSHSWDHRRIHQHTRESFFEDVRQSKDALEQVIGNQVFGFRAPTFSVVRETAWAIDALAKAGYEYDSSIFPVRHDRYGVPQAPCRPFLARGESHSILELPPLTLRMGNINLPVAGGGYFRLFPLALMKAGIHKAAQSAEGPNVAMLYFHPWEFDPGQPRLALGRVARWRTYVGITRTKKRLGSLLGRYTFVRAIDAARSLLTHQNRLPQFDVANAKNVASS
jgi:polysaccharide deacetylase family protein (PEP-CTERM system associated)